MSRRAASLAVAATFAASLVLTCSSCAVLRSDAQAVPSRAEPADVLRLTQLSFGRDAAFGVCVEPACPRVTPKTLGPAAQPLAPVAQEGSTPQLVPAVRVEPAPPPTQPAKVEAAPSSAEPISFHQIVLTFPFGSAQLTPEARAAIDDSVQRARRADRIVISGRTDAVGDVKLNEALALARALAVRDQLRDAAPDLPATIAIDAKGRCCFVASNADERGRAKNRRVEVAFTRQGGAR